VFPLLLGAILIGTAMVLLATTVAGERRSPAAARNLASGLVVSRDLREAVLAHSAGERAVQPAVAWLADRVRQLTPLGRIEALERRLLVAGAHRFWTIERILATKVVLGVVAAGYFGLRFLGAPDLLTLLTAVGVTVLGFLLPDLLLINAAQKRQDAVRRALPDILDQLAITVEAGLGFEAALARAAHSNHGPLADELQRTMQDVQAGMGRRDALRGLADRVDVSELRSFITAVIQADRYGVAIGHVLRVQGGEMRLKRSQRAEEQATKLPVKLLFPTVFFIFPALFIVLLGPAMLQIGQAF
jgi:tight adherence protein C